MKQPLGQMEGLGNSFLITERLEDTVMFVPSDLCNGELVGDVGVLHHQKKVLK